MRKHKIKGLLAIKVSLLVAASFVLSVFSSGCIDAKNRVVIFTSAESYRIDYLTDRLNEEFPEYYITVEYMSTGNHAAKLLAEGTQTECDITYDLEYGYLDKLDKLGVLADLSEYDKSVYTDDTNLSPNYLPELRLGGAVIINEKILKERGLTEPETYEDLLKPEYKGLISMANPKSSGSGYMFLKCLADLWGEKQALDYFDKLSKNILQFTSSGSGPVNALTQGEAVIALGMTQQAVIKITDHVPLKIKYFKEGSPFALYGQAIIKGKENRESVKRVFDFMINTYLRENLQEFSPEQIYKNESFTVKNFPKDIQYSKMKKPSSEQKDRLLDQWKY